MYHTSENQSYLIDPDDVCKEGKSFDLSSHEVHKNFFIEIRITPTNETFHFILYTEMNKYQKTVFKK